MSTRSKWCEFDKETGKYIKKRDNNKCIICGNNGTLQIAHIFLSRAKGGRGCKENGVLLCLKHHQELDNGRNTKQREEINKFCVNYLIEKEHLRDKYSNKNDLINRYLKFDKTQIIPQINISKILNQTKCKNCKYLAKNKYCNKSIPTYYCGITKKITSKNNKICEMYEEG